ncbi:disintegrin and metalloproteinase domain-containing protein 10-like [Bolinopsis microptera]|uniref:disintegrin and metalloproteinase domain-containing protein 10-like n=1 Tax=Bolinopsis microptera TaxID=2820187 RepID=UPI00307B0A75
MVILFLELLLLVLCEGAKEVPKSIEYHELVDYSKSTLKHEHYRHRRSLADFLSLSFIAFEKSFNLKLSKNNDVFTDDVQFTSSSGKDIDYDFYSLVKGNVNDDEESIAHGSIHNGVFEGVINFQNETYHLEPSHKYYDSPDKHSLIYRFSDVNITPQNNKCGVKDEHGSFYNIPHESIFKHTDGKIKYHNNRKKRDLSEKSTRYCSLYMAADNKFFQQHSAGFAPAIFSKLGTYVEQVNAIYHETDFPTYNHRVKFLIRKAHVYEDSDNVYDRHEYAVAKFLDLFSTKDEDQLNPDDYCIAYMFTHRDFEDGVLGLAWVASSGKDSGGLCTDCKNYDSMKSRCLNTGIVTTRNVKEVPALQSYLTFGHELGHNLGSPHDPTSCAPGSGYRGGNYLMYPHANTGNEPNNVKLSPCSTEIMGPILSIRASCFEDNVDGCGNFKKDEGEDCDCGDSVNCEKDKCCKTNCKWTKPDYTCSAMDGPCCNGNTCMPYTSDELNSKQIMCSNGTDCKKEIFCKAGTFECPVNDPIYWKVDDNNGPNPWCNKKTELCSEGECKMSICSKIAGANADTPSCQCSEEENKCKLCCPKVVDGETQCLVASNETYFPDLKNDLNDDNSKLLPGSVCGDDMGYCDIMYICRIVDADGPIASLGNYVFNGVLFDAAQNLAQEYWYYCVMLAIGMICFMSAFIAVCSKTVKPPPYPRGGERMSYPVTYKNVNSIEMRATGHM